MHTPDGGMHNVSKKKKKYRLCMHAAEAEGDLKPKGVVKGDNVTNVTKVCRRGPQSQFRPKLTASRPKLAVRPKLTASRPKLCEKVIQ